MIPLTAESDLIRRAASEAAVDGSVISTTLSVGLYHSCGIGGAGRSGRPRVLIIRAMFDEVRVLSDDSFPARRRDTVKAARPRVFDATMSGLQLGDLLDNSRLAWQRTKNTASPRRGRDWYEGGAQ